MNTEPQAHRYQFSLEGQLAPQWSSWFGDFSITLDGEGNTRLTGTVVDQAQLHGVFKKLRDVGLELISVQRIKSDQGGKL